jgi:hypothetical protein
MLSYADIVKKKSNKQWVVCANLDPIYSEIEEFINSQHPTEHSYNLEEIEFVMTLSCEDRQKFFIQASFFENTRDESCDFYSKFRKEYPNLNSDSNNCQWWSKIKTKIVNKQIHIYTLPVMLVFDEKQPDFETNWLLYQDLATILLVMSPSFVKFKNQYYGFRHFIEVTVFPVFELTKPTAGKTKTTKLPIYTLFKHQYSYHVISISVFLQKLYSLVGVHPSKIKLVCPFSNGICDYDQFFHTYPDMQSHLSFINERNIKLLEATSNVYPYIEITTPEDIHLQCVDVVKKYMFHKSSAIFENPEKVVSFHGDLRGVMLNSDFKMIKNWNVVEELYLNNNWEFLLYHGDKVIDFFQQVFNDNPRFHESLKILDLSENENESCDVILNFFGEKCPNVKIYVTDYSKTYMNLWKLKPSVKEKIIVIDRSTRFIPQWRTRN